MEQLSGGIDPKEKLVLIVDDDESILDLLEHVVKKEGFRVDRATDGQEAIRKVDVAIPDAIVLDFMLPGMGGFEVAKELQSGEARSVPILVITGRKIDQATIDMILQESNVREYIEKPIKPAVLAGRLHKLLGTKAPSGGGFDRQQRRGGLSGSW
ncbi:MAG: hypothetical protein COB53_02210 [Elusimicrobia bacterium]|nr:MAG: hypothetical protein COB53_02210 [Elusimicrobiota bacterium]